MNNYLKKIRCLIVVVSSIAAVRAYTPNALSVGLGENGDVRVGGKGARLELVVHHAGWRGRATGVGEGGVCVGTEENKVRFDLFNDQVRIGNGQATLRQTADKRAVYAVDATSVRDQNPEAVALTLTLPSAEYAGGAWSDAAGRKRTFPSVAKEKHLATGRATSFTVETVGGGEPFTLTFDSSVRYVVQDDRLWNIPTFTLRFLGNGGRTFKKGDRRAFACTLSAPSGVSATVDRPVVISRGDDWIPLDCGKDIEAGSALDFSGMGLQDAPAGKYGWLRNVGGHFEFEGRPGVPQRFYGVNLCFDANFPEPALADALVTRFVRLGYNAVRIHHYESGNGVIKGASDRLTINEDWIRRLDYLLSRAMEKGIYVTTDLYTIRSVQWGDVGIDRDGVIPWQVYKNLVGVHPPAFENWKTFARNFLTHVNSYTGRRYADEPGLPLISLINEGTLMWCWEEIRNEAPMKAAWKKWLAERRAAEPDFARGLSDDAARVPTRDNAVLVRFMADVEADLARRQREFLCSLGVKALLTNQNCGPHYALFAPVREACYDYVDNHFYVDHPKYLAGRGRLPSRLSNINPVRDGHSPLAAAAFARHFSKPYCITEWNFAAPGVFRCAGGLMTGAMGALQDWDGMWRFSYAHCIDNLLDGAARPSYFDIGADPVGHASERAAVCLFLRGDLAPLPNRVALAVTPDAFQKADGSPAGIVPDWLDAAWQVQVGLTAAPTSTLSFPILSQLRAKKAPVRLESNPSVRLDRGSNSFCVDTARTTGGFAPAGVLATGPLVFDVGDVPAAVWASSLDGQPVARSARLLVTHLTDVQDDGNAYADASRTTLVRRGKFPPVMRNGSAKVTLALDRPESYAVWALASSGRRQERLYATILDGKLAFTASVKGPHGARMFYEVVRHEGKQ
jgi:hypothetical protein